MKKVLKYIGKQFKDCDKTLLIFSILYAFIGVFLILSASSITSKLSFGTPYFYFRRQLLMVILSLVIGLIIMCFFPTRTYNFIGKWGTIALSLLLLGIMINNFSFESGNSEVTLNIFGLTIQPAEFIKVMLILYLGCSYYDWSKKEKHKKFDFILPLILCIIPSLFVVLGGDKGSFVIIAVLVAIIFLFIPTKEQSFKYTKVIVCTLMIFSFIGLEFAYKIIPDSCNSYICNRLRYNNPCDKYTSDSGYQVCNGFIAIDNGGLWGVGIGNSTQKYLYLPASHTDFIFPIVVEELGVIVSLLILLGYILIAYRIFDIATKSYNLRNSIICFGVGIYFLLHIFVNLGGVLGLIPLTGIPLPLLSYGGSSCLTIFCAFAIVQRIAIENNLTKRKKEIRKITGD